MTFQFRPAKRENVPLLLGVAGGTGSGKTYSALRIARGLAGDQPFAVIDTENGRGLHYGDAFLPWEHGPLEAPFTPARYAEAIEAAAEAGYPVIVVDSASHEHAGDGGLLDMQQQEFERMGSREAVKMASWIKPKGEHKKMVTRLLQLRAHVILCFRAEPKVDMVKDAGGKLQVVPKASLTGLDGWLPITEKSLPFELTASFLLMADRPGVPRPIKLPEQLRPLVPLDEPLSEEVGVALAGWAAGSARVGAAAAPDTLADLTARLRELASALGVAEATDELIARNRSQRGSDDDKHAQWLQRQIVKAERKLAGSGPAAAAAPQSAGAEGARTPDAEAEGRIPAHPDADAADSLAPEPSPLFRIPASARMEDKG
jgi:hypothetical protein